jgi:Rrf2 family protein
VLVTREADYAIRCVIEVVRHGRISAAHVAELQGISPTFLGKIVQSLAKAGILATRRGVGGGIALAVPVESITLLQVIEAVEGPICLNDCLTTPPKCPHVDGCPAYPYLEQAQVSLRDILNVSFVELMDRLPPVAITGVVEEPAWLPTRADGVRRASRVADAP